MSRLHYKVFGDVLIFYTIYCINKYNMICAQFVVINHLWNNIFSRLAFLCDETHFSFRWLFETFLEAIMNGKAPQTIFTNQASSITKRVKEIFSSTHHHLCK